MKRLPRVIAAFPTKAGRGRDLMQGIMTFAVQHGNWHCSFTTIDPTARTIRQASKLDGLLIQVPDVRIGELTAGLKIPVVVVGSYNPTDAPSVALDHGAMAEMAAQHLIEQGFRRFVFFAHYGMPGPRQLGTMFVRSLEKCSFKCDWFQLKRPRGDAWRPDHAPMVAWLKRIRKPVAIFTIGDTIAREVALACRDARVRVPSQVAILGVSNDTLTCKMCRPYLSSIEIPSVEMGFEAARLLHRMMTRKRDTLESIVMKPLRVITRESTEIQGAADPVVDAAIKYLRENLGEGINVKQMTRQLGKSRKVLDRAFMRQLGRTTHAEIVRMQLQQVCRLLEEEGKSLTQIASECGMHYATRLGNFFKKHMGITPLEYRRAHLRREFGGKEKALRG